MITGIGGIFFLQDRTLIYVCIALIGLGNSNIFPIIMSQALLHIPDRKNEVSGLIIMGLFGGTIFPLLMGLISDALHTQTGALLILSAGILYLTFFIPQIRRR
jgi:fucose permease